MKALLGFSSFLFISAIFAYSAYLYIYRDFIESMVLMLIWIVGFTVWINSFLLVLKIRKA